MGLKQLLVIGSLVGLSSCCDREKIKEEATREFIKNLQNGIKVLDDFYLLNVKSYIPENMTIKFGENYDIKEILRRAGHNMEYQNDSKK